MNLWISLINSFSSFLPQFRSNDYGWMKRKNVLKQTENFDKGKTLKKPKNNTDTFNCCRTEDTKTPLESVEKKIERIAVQIVPKNSFRLPATVKNVSDRYSIGKIRSRRTGRPSVRYRANPTRSGIEIEISATKVSHGCFDASCGTTAREKRNEIHNLKFPRDIRETGAAIQSHQPA